MGQPTAGDVFSEAHVEFEAWGPLLWDPLGRELVARSRPAVGERVLDACCGAGASALPAAAAVGPSGTVDGVDLAGDLLALGRARAAAGGYGWLGFVQADVLEWTAPAYDVVQFGYGAYFMPDLDAAGRQLTGLLRPGGRLAVMVWDRSAMRVVRLCVDAIRPAKPDVGPSDGRAVLDTPDRLRGWLRRLGLGATSVHRVRHTVRMDEDLAWTFVLGTGLRGYLHGLSDPQLEAVRSRYLEALEANDAWELNATSLVGVGHLTPKP